MRRLAVFISLLVLFACGFSTVVIGVLEPMTGAYGHAGLQVTKGILVAHELLPKVNGQPIRIVVTNNKSNPELASTAVERLVNYHKAVAIIGSYGDELAVRAAEMANELQIPLVVCSSTEPAATYNREYVFRAALLPSFIGRAMARFAIEVLRAKTAYIVQDLSSDYSATLAKSFRDAFIEITGDRKSVLGGVGYQSGDSDISDQLEMVKLRSPDVIFAPAETYSDMAMILKQANELGLKSIFLGGDRGDAEKLIESVGELANGIYFCDPFNIEKLGTEMTNQFVEAYRKRFAEEPSLLSFLGFDAYLMLVKAIEKAGSADREKLRQALSEIKGLTAATGEIDIDVNGDAVKKVLIKKIEDGQVIDFGFVKP